MRIHELLEACLEYVVVEGVLGADPLVVRAHLRTLDSNVDDAYFAHLWPLVARHPCTEVVISADALPDDKGVIPEGIPLTDPLQNDLFRVLDADDGGSPPIKTSDLEALIERYPSRVRLRCTEDEIYYRLTGSRKRIPKITPTIFTYLQLAARSREQGISALELGPMTDTTQNSAFHYMKVLVQLGLCAKIPASMHGSSTSVLVYRRFLGQNPHYCAYKARDRGDDTTQPGTPATQGADGEVDSEEAKTHGAAQSLGFNFTPFSELELVAGRIPKERLIRVLGHPGLKNHLLGNHHLLQVIGWPDDTWQVRHRRQLQRHILSLIEEGVVEYVDIGTSARACLRLTKYNPDFTPIVKAETGGQQEEKEVSFSLAEYEKPFQFNGGASATQSIESQILSAIANSGLKGCTLADVHKHLSSMFKRTLEHVVNRHDLAYLPPHLQRHAIRCVIESHQRMRRLRVFTSDAYLKYMEQLGQPLDVPPAIEHPGPYADLSFRAFANSPDEYYAESEELAAAIVPVGKVLTGRQRNYGGATPRGGAKGRKSEPKSTARKGKATKVAVTPIHSSPIKFKYDNDVQERGRPRKYVFIVNADGTRNRHVVGNLLASPDLPAVLVYLKDEDLLVDAPPGYTGVGEPPKITEEQIAATGKPPEYYRPMAEKKDKPKPKAKKGKGKAKAKGKGKGKKKAEEDDEEEAEAEEESGAEMQVDEEQVPPSSPTAAPAAKRRRTGPAPAVVEEAVEEPQPEALTLTETPALAAPADETSSVPPIIDGTPVAPPVVDAAPEPETPTPGRAKRPRRAAARALSALTRSASRSATPSDRASPEPEPEPAAKRPRRFQKVTKRDPTPEPPVIDPELVALSEEAAPAPPPAAETAAPAVDKEEEMDVDASLAVPSEVQSEAAAEQPAEPTQAAQPVESEVPAPPKEEEEPLKSIDDLQGEEVKQEQRPTPRVVRVDIAVLRRANEIYQCLLDNGGVLSDQKLYIEQTNWSHKYAGTDHPNAPQVGASMDRKVFKRMINRLKDDGRLKERIATIPTTTGRWIKVPVLYVADTDEAEIQQYIRGLANSTVPPGTPVATARSKSSLEYSAYRRAAPRTSTRLQSGTPRQSPAPSTPNQKAQQNEGLSQREIFLSEPSMPAYLYGFQSGRCLRAKILHMGLVEAFNAKIESKSIVSDSPRVFALPFVFEDLRVRDYFAFVQVRGYDEELYQWLQVPEHLDIRLRDMPPDIAERAALTGRGSSGAKSMTRTLLSMLAFLQLIMPLVPASKENSVVHCAENNSDQIAHFAKGVDVNTATYFLLHDVVPIYNIADAALPCLGFMSAKTVPEVELVWRLIKHASLEPQPPFVRRMEVPPFPYAPDISGVLDMTIDHPKTLRGRSRWRHDIRLVPQQRANLDAAIDMTARTRRVTEAEDVAKLAYDNGLRPSFVDQYLDRRVRQLQGEGNFVVRLAAGEKAAVTRQRERERRQKQKEAIRDELAARIRAARKVYDQRVAAAAERAGVEVNQELRDYITHNRPMSRLGEIASDAELTAIIESYIRVKSGVVRARRTTSVRPAPPVVRSQVTAKTRVKKRLNPHAKQRRYRHNWTKEDEELLIDGEAVIRARCRGTTNRGRLAMVQIFPNISDQVLRTKLKKLLEQPGREPYYRRLEEAFYHLWVEYRGSPELPDLNPTSHTDFDLRVHIDFLRARVNKNLLKLPVPSSTPSANSRAPDLPLIPMDVATVYQWEYLKSINTSMDQLVEATTTAEDTRLHNVSLASVVVEDPRKHRNDIMRLTRIQGVTRAVLKMIVATPTEIYSTQDASEVLCQPRDVYEPLIAALVNEQVLLKNISGSARQVPGRMYGFTTQWLQQSDNLLPPDLDKEIDAALERFNNPEQTAPWPLIGGGGDIAVLMTMVSNHEAEFDIDLSNLPSLRTTRLQYNTRALNDDAFEFDLSVRRTSRDFAPKIPLPKPRDFPRMAQWPETGVHASNADIEQVVAAVRAAGVDGLERGMMSAQLNMPVEVVDSVLAGLALEEKPRFFWAGYNNACLVSATYWPDWSASVSPRAEDRVAPAEPGHVVPAAARRWVDIWGDLIVSDWQRALKLVIGAITQRTGLTEANLRARVSTYLDRLETCDLLQYLVDSGMMTRQLSIPTHRPLPPVHATDTNEMPFIVWLPNPAFLWSPTAPVEADN